MGTGQSQTSATRSGTSAAADHQVTSAQTSASSTSDTVPVTASAPRGATETMGEHGVTAAVPRNSTVVAPPPPATSHAPSTLVTSQRPEQTIKQVDLGSRTYLVGDEHRSVTLRDGRATDTYGRITELRSIVYSDADGDGFPDAAVELAVTDGNGYEAFWYVLRWDRGSREPVQIADPFGRTFRCGDVVDSVTPAGRGLTVTEHRTQGTPSNCAAKPPIRLTRTIAARGPWLVELAPHHGYGGICPRAVGDDGDHRPPARLRIAPDPTAPAVTDKVKGAWLIARPSHSLYVEESGWMLVGYSTTSRTETWYSSCAWMLVH